MLLVILVSRRVQDQGGHVGEQGKCVEGIGLGVYVPSPVFDVDRRITEVSSWKKMRK